MTIRVSFNLPAVASLAAHAVAAAGHVHPTGSTCAGAALLLSSGSNGIWLTSNAMPAPAAPAGQPGSRHTLAAFADQCPPGTAWLEQVQLLHREGPLAEVLPLHEPAGNPLIAGLRAGADAGFTTWTVILSGADLTIAVSRHRDRSHRSVTA
jgi:hypothetical protein